MINWLDLLLPGGGRRGSSLVTIHYGLRRCSTPLPNAWGFWGTPLGWGTQPSALSAEWVPGGPRNGRDPDSILSPFLAY